MEKFNFKLLENIEITEEQAKEFQNFLEDYKRQLLESFKEEQKIFIQNEINRAKKVLLKKANKKLNENKKNYQKKLNAVKALNESKMLDLISTISEKTESKILFESEKNDPIYESFNNVKKIVAPFLGNGLEIEKTSIMESNKISSIIDTFVNFNSAKTLIESSELSDKQKAEMYSKLDLMDENFETNLSKRIEQYKTSAKTKMKQTTPKEYDTKTNIMESLIENIVKENKVDEKKVRGILEKNKEKVDKMILENKEENVKKIVLKKLEKLNESKETKKEVKEPVKKVKKEVKKSVKKTSEIVENVDDLMIGFGDSIE